MRFGSEISANQSPWPFHQNPAASFISRPSHTFENGTPTHSTIYYPAICTNFQVTSLEIHYGSASYVRTDRQLPLFNPMPNSALDVIEPRFRVHKSAIFDDDFQDKK